jgi:hypothetical protein
MDTRSTIEDCNSIRNTLIESGVSFYICGISKNLHESFLDAGKELVFNPTRLRA